MSSAAKRIYSRGKKLLSAFLFPKKKAHKILLASLAVAGVVFSIFLFAHPAEAQGALFGDPGWMVTALMRFFSKVMIKLAVICIQITLWLLRMFMLVAGYNNYINAPVVILGWNMVRDVANMFFIVVLMVIAFGTILGLEQYEWKKTLVKLIIAALFVNFSNMIMQLMIDVAQVFTITFLNAVAGAAGGNLIQMFNVEKIFNIATINSASEDVAVDIFGGAVMSLVFAATAMFTMGAYVVILLARLVVLWALIILSPLGFLFQALPQTKSYADEFWQEFTHHVLAAPVMVFFLWLAFSTFGGEGISSHLEFSHPLGGQARVSNTEDITGQTPGVSINAAASWDSMANFAVAIAFLWMGVERVQKLGVRAGGLAQGALDFGKKVATIASGYAAGRWLVGKAGETVGGVGDLAKKGTKGALWYFPAVGGEKWALRGKNLGHAVKGWYYGKGTSVTAKGEQLLDNIQKNKQKLKFGMSADERADVQSDIVASENKLKNLHERQTKGEDVSHQIAETKEHLEHQKAVFARTTVMEAPEKKRLQDEVASDEKALKKEVGTGVIGRVARSGIALQKQLAKTEKQAENRRLLLWKQTGSEAGGYMFGRVGQKLGLGFGMGTEGLFHIGKLAQKGGRYTRWAGMGYDRYYGVDAQDRIERGWLQAEEMRSKAKDEEFETLGKEQTLSRPRLKYDTKKGVGFLFEGQSVAHQIGEHQMLGHLHSEAIKHLEQEVQLDFILNHKEVRRAYRRLDKELAGTKEGKPQYAYTHEDVEERKAKAKILTDTVSAAEERGLKQHLTRLYMSGLNIDESAGDVGRGVLDKQIRELNEKIRGLADKRQKMRSDIGIGKADQELRELKDQLEEAKKQRMDAALSQLNERQRDPRDKIKDLEAKLATETKKKKDQRDEALVTTLAQQLGEEKKTFENIEKEKAEMRDRVSAEFEAADETKKARGEMAAREQVIKAGEEKLNKNADYAGVETEIKKAGGQINSRSEVLKDLADRIRKGQQPAFDELLRGLRESLSAADQTQKGYWQAKIRQWEALKKESAAGGNLGWQYGVQKGIEEDVGKGFSYSHNSILSKAAQRTIHDGRGIDTPTTAMTEIIERAAKDYNEMSIDSFVANAGTMVATMVKKAQEAEARGEQLSPTEIAASMGLFKRGFDRAWLDDAIYAIRGNEEAKKLVGDALGWQDNVYRDDKIRDVQMLFASGFNVGFVKDNAVISHIQDEAAQKKYNISAENVETGLKSGRFVNRDGKDITAQLKQGVQTYMEEGDMAFTEAQNKLFDDFFDVTKKYDDAKRAQLTQTFNRWVEIQGEHQAEMQFLGNLRSEALKNGHTENAGWALSTKLNDGRTLYLGSGIRRARAHVHGDAKKMTAADRASFQTHSIADLDEDNGQVITNLRESDYIDIRGNVTDPNTHRRTNARDRLLRAGLGAQDRVENFRDENSTFSVGMVRHKDGTYTTAAKAYAAHYKRTHKGEDLTKKSEAEQKAYSAQFAMKRVMAPQMHGNISDFLMTMAEHSGINTLTALQEGKINLRIYNPVKKSEMHYQEIARLIEDWNRGDWTEGVAPERQIPKFIPRQGRPESAAEMDFAGNV